MQGGGQTLSVSRALSAPLQRKADTITRARAHARVAGCEDAPGGTHVILGLKFQQEIEHFVEASDFESIVDTLARKIGQHIGARKVGQDGC